MPRRLRVMAGSAKLGHQRVSQENVASQFRPAALARLSPPFLFLMFVLLECSKPIDHGRKQRGAVPIAGILVFPSESYHPDAARDCEALQRFNNTNQD